MGKMYKGFENAIIRLPEKLKKAKLVMSEKQAIRHKREFYEKVQWTPEQTAEMGAFWQKYYGVRISDRWHKLYQNMNGVYCKDYFPEMLYTTELEYVLNPSEYGRFFNDKSLIEFLYGHVEGVRLPKTLLVRCNGTYCDGEHQLLTPEAAIKTAANLGPCIIKPTVETGSGKGVAVLNVQDGIDQKTGKSVQELFETEGKDFIIQEKLKNSARFAAIYPNAINTIRLITFIVENEVHYAPLVMRIGVGGHEVDNIHMGGLCVGVNPDGTLKKEAYQLGYGDTAIKYTRHPDTDIEFEHYYIGDIGQMIEAAKRLHRRTPHVGMISWDFTINDQEQIVLIEANCKDQSIWFPQIVNEAPIFGKDTPYMLKKIYGRRKI